MEPPYVSEGFAALDAKFENPSLRGMVLGTLGGCPQAISLLATLIFRAIFCLMAAPTTVAFGFVVVRREREVDSWALHFVFLAAAGFDSGDPEIPLGRERPLCSGT
jgi:hypothetical protein